MRARRHGERSSGSRRRNARAASAYAKFGPALAVAPKSEHHCIHCAGPARKSCGAASARSMPVVIGMVRRPIRPMSW